MRIHRLLVCWLILGGLLLLAGCARKEASFGAGAPQVEGLAPAGAMLAYEHELSVALAAEAVPPRMAGLRSACLEARHGPCSLLEYSETGGRHGHSVLRLRVAPEAVQPLVALAAEDGNVLSHTTRAEDLAETVADTARQRRQLEAQRDRLLAFQERSDLTVADLLSIARELASVEVRLQELEQVSAQQQRRLETNLLSFRFASLGEEPSRSRRIAESFGAALDALTDGVAETIELAAYGLPFLILLFPMALLWRWLWRRATGAGR